MPAQRAMQASRAAAAGSPAFSDRARRATRPSPPISSGSPPSATAAARATPPSSPTSAAARHSATRARLESRPSPPTMGELRYLPTRARRAARPSSPMLAEPPDSPTSARRETRPSSPLRAARPCSRSSALAVMARSRPRPGGVFDMSGLIAGGMTAGSIEGAGNYFLGSKTLTIIGNNLFAEISGAIQDGGASGGRGGSLVKEGIGVLLLSGNNTYTGTTTVNAGALVVNGSIASSSLTTVNEGAALIGSGTVGSTVVNRGGFLVPGSVNAGQHDGLRRSHRPARRVLCRAGEPPDGFADQCERHRLAGRHRRGHL